MSVDLQKVNLAVDKLYPEVSRIIHERSLTFSSEQVYLVVLCMEIVEKYGGLSGPEKQEVVVQIIGKLTEDITDDYISDSAMIRQITDVVVMATRGLFHLNNNRGKVMEVLSKLCSCCKK